MVCVLRPLAVRLGYVDTPGERKCHDGKVPMIGGLSIYATLLVLCLFFSFWRVQNGVWLIALGLPLLLIGMADDMLQLSASWRLARRNLLQPDCRGLLRRPAR